MVVSADELAQARADVETQLLHDSVVVRRRTTARDSSGGQTETWTTAWSGNGKVAPSSAQEAEHAMRLHHDTSVTITLPYTADVTADDKVAIGGVTYDVFGVMAARTWDLVRRVLAVEVG